MITNRYISTISGFLAIVLIVNVVIPAIAHCMVLADCEMMGMNHNEEMAMHPHSMSVMDSPVKDDRNSHCDMMKSAPLHTVERHSFTECHCIDSTLYVNGSSVFPPKPSISVDVRDFVYSEKHSIHFEYYSDVIDDFNPDPTPPDLFISFEALLI